MKRRILGLAAAIAVGVSLVGITPSLGTAKSISAPTCSLSIPGNGTIQDTLSGLKTSGGTYEWYIATLDGPTGQQIWYFRPGPTSYTVPFTYQGPGSYTGGLEITVDNNKGPAKYTILSTNCVATG